jgi:NAD/NADP transhydrogenase alpha subunit
VAATPDTVKALVKDGHKVVIENGAGVNASFSDDAYAQQGATIVPKAE